MQKLGNLLTNLTSLFPISNSGYCTQFCNNYFAFSTLFFIWISETTFKIIYLPPALLLLLFRVWILDNVAQNIFVKGKPNGITF